MAAYIFPLRFTLSDETLILFEFFLLLTELCLSQFFPSSLLDILFGSVRKYDVVKKYRVVGFTNSDHVTEGF